MDKTDRSTSKLVQFKAQNHNFHHALQPDQIIAQFRLEFAFDDKIILRIIVTVRFESSRFFRLNKLQASWWDNFDLARSQCQNKNLEKESDEAHLFERI